MPARHRAAASSLVTALPPKVTAPASGDRSPEIRPNRLVLPAPFGPTIPTVSPALTENDRSSAMTTRPNRFVTCSSSSNGLSSAHLKVGSRSPVILARYVRSANACANQDCQQVSQTLRVPAGEVNARYVTVSWD